MSKGGNYERELCKTLSLWLSYGKDDDCLWRSSQSGGRATIRAKKGKKTEGHAGDLSATNKIGRQFLKRFAVEIKRGYPKSTVIDVLDCPSMNKMSKGNYRTWFKQARDAMNMSGAKAWMLIHKRNRRDALVFVYEWVWEDLELEEVILSHITYAQANRVVKGFRLKDLLELDPKILEKIKL